jgi:hypothetical protein
MARPRILISLVISVPIVVAASRLYRPHLGMSLGAFVDLLLVAILCFVIVRVIQHFED